MAEAPLNLHRPGWWADLHDPVERELGKEFDRVLAGSAANPLLSPFMRAAIVGCLLVKFRELLVDPDPQRDRLAGEASAAAGEGGR